MNLIHYIYDPGEVAEDEYGWSWWQNLGFTIANDKSITIELMEKGRRSEAFIYVKEDKFM